MEVISNSFMPGDPRLVQQLVNELKSQGIFDQFRKECFADVDTKPAYQNLRQRVEGSVAAFLKEQTWSPDMNKNQVREQLKKNIYESGYLETGVERIVDQVVNPKINTIFLPIVEDVVYKYLGIEKRQDPEIKSTENVTDLLPKDLEAVSPESESSKLEDQKDGADTLNDSTNSKMDEDESPPFEPLEGVPQNLTTLQEETSMDSEFSGISGLQSHESNLANESKGNQIDWCWQDGQLSQNSSESKLSAFTSEEQKTEISRDIVFPGNVDLDILGGINKIEEDTLKTEDSVESMNTYEDDSTIDSQKQDKIKEEKTLELDSTEQKSKIKEDDNKKNKINRSSDSRRDEKKSKSSSHKTSLKDDKHSLKEEKYSSKEDKHSTKDDKHSSKDDKYRKSSSSNKDKDKSSSRHSSSSKDRDLKENAVKGKDKNKDSKDESKNKEKESRVSKENNEKDRHDKDRSKEKDKYSKNKEKEYEKSTKQKHDREKKSKKEDEKEKSEDERSRSADKEKEKSSKEKSERQKTDKELSSKDTIEKERNRSKDRSDKNKSHKDKEKIKKSNDKSDKSDKKERDRSKSSSSVSEKTSSNSKESSSSATHNKKKESEKDGKSVDKHKKDKHSRDKSSERNKDKKRDSKKDDHYSSKEKKNTRRSFDRDSSDGQSGKPSNTITSENRISSSQQSSTKDSSSNSFSGSGDSANSDANEIVTENQEEPKADNETQPSLVEVPKMKYIKPKFALNFEEAKRIMKIRRQLAILERQNQLSLADLNIGQNGFTKRKPGRKPKREINEIENSEDNTNDDGAYTPKTSPFRGFDRDSEQDSENSTVVDTKEKLTSAELNLQSIFLSKENWEALEARLEQEMLKINFNAYESHYDDYDDSECSAVTFSPTKSTSVGNSCVIEEIISQRISDNENQKSGNDIKDNQGMNQESVYVGTNEIEEIVEVDPQIVETEVIEDLVGANVTIIEEPDEEKGTEKNTNNYETERKELSIRLLDMGMSDNSNYTLKTGLDGNGCCTHFDKSDELVLRNVQILHKIIEKLENDLKYAIKEYQNNILPEASVSVKKRGRKRKLDENADLKNNNRLIYKKITGIKKRGRPPKASNLNLSVNKSCNITDILANQNFSLPLSPAESEASTDKQPEHPVVPVKQRRVTTPRMQRYTSDDLYKPRPSVPGTKRSKREKNP